MATTDLSVLINPPLAEEPVEQALFHCPEAVTLQPAGASSPEARIRVERERPGVFRKQVDPGTYVVRAEPDAPADGRWHVPEWRVQVRGKHQELQVFMGEPGWPSYQIGYSLVPFRPPDTVAIVFETAPPAPGEADRLLAAVRRQFELELAPPELGALRLGERVLRPAGGSILLMRGNFARHNPEAIEDFVARFLDRRPRLAPPRVGVAVDLRPGRVKVLDRRFVLRHAGGNPLAKKVVEDIGGRWIEDLDSAPGTILFELRGGDHQRHIDLVERLRRNEAVAYVEPDLMCELEDADDPLFARRREKIPEAWASLDQRGLPLLGSENVRIAILDGYFDYNSVTKKINHAQAPANQVVDFRDFYDGPDPGGSIGDPFHGLKVYGVVAAERNDLGAEGVAPGTSIFLATRPSVASHSYNNILLWLCGLKDVVPGFPHASARNPHPVDVICCAHASGCPRTQPFSDTMELIATKGRVVAGTARGAIVVYAAGNANGYVRVWNGFADDANTIAVANCRVNRSADLDDPKKFERVSISNFGKAVDLCALGEQSHTLLSNGQDGPWANGGTSAACAVVAGAVGLLLTAFPDETFSQIRDRLKSGAKLVDPDQKNSDGAWHDHHSGYYGNGLLNLYQSMKK